MEQRVEEQLQRFQRLKASVHEAVGIPEFGFLPPLASNMLPLASPPAAHPTGSFFTLSTAYAVSWATILLLYVRCPTQESAGR
jgi:hypothetical protein